MFVVSEKLKILIDYGLYIFIDDFGMVYLLMINFYRLFINELKIDCIFIFEMGKNYKVWGIVESLVILFKCM